MSDDLQPDVCSAAPYLLSLSEEHAPPEYGGRVKLREDLNGPYVDVMLLGLHDSQNISAPDPNLEDTGTYSVSPAHPHAFQPSALASHTLAFLLAGLPRLLWLGAALIALQHVGARALRLRPLPRRAAARAPCKNKSKPSPPTHTCTTDATPVLGRSGTSHRVRHAANLNPAYTHTHTHAHPHTQCSQISQTRTPNRRRTR